MNDGGKGSARRPGDGYQDNWERIWGKKTVAEESTATEYDCPVCGTELSITGTGLHWHCDVCGYNEAVVSDEP